MAAWVIFCDESRFCSRSLEYGVTQDRGARFHWVAVVSAQISDIRNTLRSYATNIEPFCQESGGRLIGFVTLKEAHFFLNRRTIGDRSNTNRICHSFIKRRILGRC